MKKILLPVLAFSTLFCACEAQVEGSESGSTTETAIETESFKNQYESWEEYAATLIPPLDSSDDPDWEAKIHYSIDPTIAEEVFPPLAVLDGKIYENGKYLIQLFLADPAFDLVYKLALTRTDIDPFGPQEGAALRDAEKLIDLTYNHWFLEKYVSNMQDICYNYKLSGHLILYASAEDIERYAKCKLVVRMVSADSLLEHHHSSDLFLEQTTQ